MAERKDFSYKQYATIAGTSTGIAPSASRLFGPWESESDMTTFVQDIGAEGIPSGTLAGFIQGDGIIVVKRWQKLITGPRAGYWEDHTIGGIIPIGGIMSEGILNGETQTTKAATWRNVWWHAELKRLVYSEDGLNYYRTWVNYPIWGNIDDDERMVVPREGWLYVSPTTGQLLLASSEELDDAEGGLSPEYQAGLEKLLSLQLNFAGDSMSYKDPVSGETKTVNFQQGGAVTDTYSYTITPSGNALSIAGYTTEDIEVIITPLGGASVQNVRPAINAVATGSNVTISKSENITNNVLTVTYHVKGEAVGTDTVTVTVGSETKTIGVEVTALAVESLKFDVSSLAYDGQATVTGKLVYEPKGATFAAAAIDTAHKTSSYSASQAEVFYDYVSGLESATVGTIDREAGTIDFTVVLEKTVRQPRNNYEDAFKGTSTRLAQLAVAFDGGTPLLCNVASDGATFYLPCAGFDRSGGVAGLHEKSVTLTNGNSSSDISPLVANEVAITNYGVTKVSMTKRASGDKTYAVALTGLDFGDEIIVDSNMNLTADAYVKLFVRSSSDGGLIPLGDTTLNFSDVTPTFKLPQYASAMMKFGQKAGVYFKLDAMQGEVYNSSNPTQTSTVATTNYQIDPTQTGMKVWVVFRGMNAAASAPVIFVKHLAQAGTQTAG